MGYTFPTTKYRVSADVAALATFLAQRQSDSGTTNGGITASGGSAAVPQLGVDSAGLGIAYLSGTADALLCAVGYQANIVDAVGPAASNTTTSGTYVNMPTGASGTFTAPFARNYEVSVDISSIYVATAQPTLVAFRLVVNGTPITPLNMMQTWFNAVLDRRNLSFRQQVAMVAGSNTVQLQWAVTSGTGVATWDNNSYLAVHVRG